MSNMPQEITRREILKRGAVVGGTVLWLTPVVQTLGMGRAFAQTPSDVCVPSWASAVYSYSQGSRRDTSAVLASRSNPENALGDPTDAPDNPGEENFFALGFGGQMIVQLGTPYYSGKSGEAIVVETTNFSYPLEKADVSVSGSAAGPWTLVGTAKNTGSPALKVPLDGVPGLPAIVAYVKIEDDTDQASFPEPTYSEADAFDVNAVGIGCP